MTFVPEKQCKKFVTQTTFLLVFADYDDMTEKKKQKNKLNKFYFVVE